MSSWSGLQDRSLSLRVSGGSKWMNLTLALLLSIYIISMTQNLAEETFALTRRCRHR